MIRAFIAIEISEEVRAAVNEMQARLKQARLSVKMSWTKVENLHLTLQFLGYIEEPTILKISAALEGLSCRHAGCDIVISGAGAFPDREYPRVLWIGCRDIAGRLATLAMAVQGATESLGFLPERRAFMAHLTLGRIQHPQPDAALTKTLDSLKDTACGVMRVDAIHLYQSQLHSAGSIYTKRSSHTLKGE